MGAYLSEPLTAKISSDEANERLAWGTSSMQGWRMSQEDAHNCITEYDDHSSYFAVYDGHGGFEVAEYCSQKLPEFIKLTEAYKNGDISQALIDGYLGFDATVVTKDVIKILEELADKAKRQSFQRNGEDVIGEEEDEEDNVLSLKKEAHMPLEEVMAKYQDKGLLHRLIRDNEGNPLSPFLKAKGQKQKDEAGSSGDSLASSSLTKATKCDNSVSSSTNEANKSNTGEDAQVSTSNGETSSAVPDASSSKITEEAVAESSKVLESEPLPDSSNDNCADPVTGSIDLKKEPEMNESPDANGTIPTTSDDSKNVPDSESSKIITQSKEEINCNGEVSESTKPSVGNVSSSSQESEEPKNAVSIKGKGKAKAVVSSTEKLQKSQEEGDTVVERTRRAAAILNSFLSNMEDDDDDSDSNDETFQGQEEASSSDENEVNGVENGSSGDDEDEDAEEDSSEEDDDEESESYDDINIADSDGPGMDSGCTAVVAILKRNQLYVANAGDSRCVVCREGQAVDMSVDHKPEDPVEFARVEKAGGKVNNDGRINGGLNLSRAIGDHSYKQNKELNDKEQMITALPDIKILTIDPEKDHFMVLACDGIWNFMTSQEVVDFISERINDASKSLSQICEELFDKCLAPNTEGDGTGCDNMTAIIIKFKALAPKGNDIPSEISKKRPVEEEQDGDENVSKRLKTDEAVMSAAVTSSE